MKTWFQIKNAEGSKKSEIFIFDEIGLWGITAKDFAQELRTIPEGNDVEVRINSGGGSVFDGLAMRSLLANLKGNTTAIVEGICASIATVIALGCKKVVMSKNSFFMIHNPEGVAIGESEDMRKTAELMDSIRDQIADIYAKKTGQTVQMIKEWMDSEKWMTSDEAQSLGFVDSIGEEVLVKASADFRKFRRVPEAFANHTGDNAPASQPQKNTMKTIMNKLAEAKLIPSAELSEADALAALTASVASQNSTINSLISENDELKKKIEKYRKTEADLFIENAIKDGKIRNDEAAKTAFRELFMGNPELATATVNAITPAKTAKRDSLPEGDPITETKAQKISRIENALKDEQDPSKKYKLCKELAKAQAE